VLLDFGGTHTKAEAWRNGKKVRHVSAASTPIAVGSNGERTISTKLFASHVHEVFQYITEDLDSRPQVAITGQMATFIIVDQSGSPLTPIISWQDDRSQIFGVNNKSWFEDLRKVLTAHGYGFWDGLRPGMPICYISALVEQGLQMDNAVILSINQYAALLLNPKLSPGDLRMHKSEAASTGLYNPIKDCWETSIAKVLEIPVSALPSILTEIGPIGEKIQDETEIFTPIGDFQAALIGTDLRENEIFIHIATGGQVARILDRQNNKFETQETWNDLQIRPSAVGSDLVLTKTHLPAGRLLAGLVSLLATTGIENPWERIDKALGEDCRIKFESENESPDIFHLKGFRTDGFDVDQLVTAVVTGLHHRYVDFAMKLVSPETEGLVFSGGALNKLPRFMRKFEEELENCQSRRFVNDDTSLLGLGYLLNVVDSRRTH
jgi:hypothetical protein